MGVEVRGCEWRKGGAEGRRKKKEVWGKENSVMSKSKNSNKR